MSRLSWELKPDRNLCQISESVRLVDFPKTNERESPRQADGLPWSQHLIAVAAGLSALFKSVPIAYAIFKLVGGLYLVWLGVSVFRSRETSTEASIAPSRLF